MAIQILKIIVARAIWLLPTGDINPTGKAISADLIAFLREKYHFQKFPSSAFDFDDNQSQTLTFAGGKFNAGHNGLDRFVQVKLTAYADGLVVDTESSTADSNGFLSDLLTSIVKEFGLINPSIRKVSYYNEMDVRLDKPLSCLNPKLVGIAKRISELKGDPPVEFEFSGVTFFPDLSAQPSTSHFSLERKINTDWSENRFYTRAPLQTADHLRLLNELAELLT